MNKRKIDNELKALDKSIVAPIENAFSEMQFALEEMDKEYNEVLSKEITKEVCGDARGLRLRIAKVRIDGDKWKKKEKAQYLVVGNVIQGLYNILKTETSTKEDKLKEIEEFYEREAARKLEVLQVKREKEVEPYGIDGSLMKLGEMDQNVWENYLKGLKATYEKEREAEKEKTLRDEQFAVMEKRKVALMPYAQFHPFVDLYPETTEEEYQELLASMVKAKDDFDKSQAEMLEKQAAIEAENKKLREQIAEDKPDKEEFKKNMLSGLLGKNFVPASSLEVPEKSTESQAQLFNSEEQKMPDKEIILNIAILIKEKIEIVESKEAKKALSLAQNTLNIAAMMM